MFRIVWGITGSGERIQDIVDLVCELERDARIRLKVVVSKAGEQVLRWYGLWTRLAGYVQRLQVETDANVPFIAGPLQVGKYDLLVVAPLTANSTAKIAYGVADTLITNAVAQTLKGPTPVIVFPVDQSLGKVTTTGPKGEEFKVHVRPIDWDNVERLRGMRGFTVMSSPEEVIEHANSLVQEREAL
ncbi:MAG: archaeoflavoprotein AfpA [Candidatus Thorarchaeota archaeon]